MVKDVLQNILLFPIQKELYLLDCNNILYMQADDHYTFVYYLSGVRFMIPFGLSKVTDRIMGNFPNQRFLVRLGRKFVVNLRAIFHVNTVKEVLLLTDNFGRNHTIHVPKDTLRDLIVKMGNSLKYNIN